MNQPTPRQLYTRLLSYLKPYRTAFALALVATACVAATDPAIAALMKPLLNGSFIERDPDAIVFVPLALVGLFLVRSVASFFSGVGMAWVGSRVVTDLRQQMFAKLLRLPGTFYDGTTGGTLISRFTYDATQLMGATTGVLVTLVRDSLSVAGLFGLMLYLNWQLTLIMLATAPVIGLLAGIVSRRLRKLNSGMQQAMGQLTHTLDEAIGGERIIKIYNAKGQEQTRFNQASTRVHHFLMKVRIAGALFTPTVQVITVIALAAVVYLAASGRVGGQQSVGDIIALFGAAGMLMAPIKRLTRINEPLQAGLAAAESLFALLDRDEEPDTGSHTPDKVRGALRIEGVSFAYPGATHGAVQDISLEIAAGETVALVGPSGSGKSTLIKLLPRLYSVDSGRILLDGVDINEYTLDGLRGCFSYVGQETVLFNDTVAANIAYGMAGTADMKAIEEAARRAHALEFIERLPEGFDTVIGEDGAQLSGGQRQRLAIARALLRDAPILLLDEATSALDNQSVAVVQAALDEARIGRTTLVVAHRLSTVIKADRLAVIDQGGLVAIGNHFTLLQTCPLYQQLHQSNA